MTRALVLAALAACTIKDLDYTGKDCPCPGGYVCNTPTQTCVKSLSPDSGGNGGEGGSQSDGSVMGDSCFPNPMTKLVYSSVGFPDFPNAWLSGVGSWSKDTAELQQINASNPVAWVSHNVTTQNGMASYRVVATARVIDSLGGGGAGVAFRATTQNASLYGCDFVPITGELRLHRVANLQPVELTARTLTPPVNDPRDPFTIEVMTTGALHACCVRGYPGMVLSVQDATLTQGAPGIASFDAEAGWTSIHVYE